jgi:hypothetical protein
LGAAGLEEAAMAEGLEAAGSEEADWEAAGLARVEASAAAG